MHFNKSWLISLPPSSRDTSWYHFITSYDLTPKVLVDFGQFQLKANKLDFIWFISDLIKKKYNEERIPKSKVGLFLFMTHQLWIIKKDDKYWLVWLPTTDPNWPMTRVFARFAAYSVQNLKFSDLLWQVLIFTVVWRFSTIELHLVDQDVKILQHKIIVFLDVAFLVFIM